MWRKLPGQSTHSSTARRRSARESRGTGVGPRGRRGHSAHALQDCLLIYGGYKDLRGSTNELWAFHYGKNILCWNARNTITLGYIPCNEYLSCRVGVVAPGALRHPGPGAAPARRRAARRAPLRARGTVRPARLQRPVALRHQYVTSHDRFIQEGPDVTIQKLKTPEKK